MAAEYQVISTQAYTYLDKSNTPVNGFRVFVFFPSFQETYPIFVPNLNKEVVKAAIEHLLADRQALSKL